MPRLRMESFMNSGSSLLQCEQVMWSPRETGIARSPSQARHLKWTIGVMKAFVVMLLIAASLEAQSIADVARRERERQARLRPTQVITSTESTKAESPKDA